MENMNPPPFVSMWTIHLAHIYAMSIIDSVANLVAMTFFMHMNFTDLFFHCH